MEKFRTDSHKLMFHVERVHQWMKGGIIYPIYIEISPSGACNHRCIFCALDYVGYKRRFIDTDILKKRLKEMGRCGVKSIRYSGEGEPLLHKDIIEIISATKKAGIDIALTTNGALFGDEIARKTLGMLTWMRFSVDAGTKKTHSEVHGTAYGDFDRILKNIASAVKIRNRNKYRTTIGVQFLLIPENCDEPVILASILKKIGVDYLVIKPYSQHPMSRHSIDKNFHYSNYLSLDKRLQKFSTDKFKIIFRSHTMEKLGEKRTYPHCLGLPFWAYIDSAGDVWSCIGKIGNPDFLCGNIYKNTFQEIFSGSRRKKVLKMAAATLDTGICREVCRLDEINRYLWELKHPHPHVNFI